MVRLSHTRYQPDIRARRCASDPAVVPGSSIRNRRVHERKFVSLSSPGPTNRLLDLLFALVPVSHKILESNIRQWMLEDLLHHIEGYRRDVSPGFCCP